MRDFLVANFDRFPFSGLTLLVFKNTTRDEVEADLRALIDAPGIDEREAARRRDLLRLFETQETCEPIQFTALSMEKRR
jgi:hypothetical protein